MNTDDGTNMSTASGAAGAAFDGGTTPVTSAEQRLEKAEARYRTLVEQIPAITFIASLENTDNEMYVSPQIERILGYTQEEWLGDPTLWFNRLHSDDRARWSVEFAQTCASSKPFRSEYRFISRDGRVVWILGEARVVRSEDGRPLFLQGVAFDITEQKRAEAVMLQTRAELEEQVQQRTRELRAAVDALQAQVSERRRAEEALRDQEARLRSVLETAVDAILVIDEGGTVESFNLAAEKLFGYAAEEVLGRNVSVLMPTPYREEHDGYLQNYMKTGVARIIGIGREVDIQRKDGSCVPVELAVSAILIGNQRKFTGIIRDISYRKRVELQLREAREVAEAANQAKSAFLANMSHEIRTPMTAILGFADTLFDTLKDRQERLAVSTIRRNGEHLLELINDILDLSKVEAGKLTIERIACSTVQIIADVVSLMRVRADAKGLTLTTEYRTSVPAEIETDPTRLRQILVNLLGNAVKFTQKGSVRLVVSFDDDGTTPRLNYEVIDTGIGMSAEQVRRAFEPFAQADASTTRQHGGTGLGLAICKRLASLLGGEISVRSEPGRGSSFKVSIRAPYRAGVEMVSETARESVHAPCENSAPRGDVLTGCRILLAEDGRDNQRLIAYVLGRAGADVCVVDNGRQAVDTARTAASAGSAFDVVLLDMQMPVMDGYEAARVLRDSGFSGPIIALTAHAMAGDRQKCIDAGCDDYASKPVDRIHLTDLIHAWWRGSATTPTSRSARVRVPLFSDITADSGFAKILEVFVDEMPGRIRDLEEALHRNDLAGLARLAHQLAGASGGYGFPSISAAARSVQRAIQDHEEIDRIESQVSLLVELCQRARSRREAAPTSAPPSH